MINVGDIVARDGRAGSQHIFVVESLSDRRDIVWGWMRYHAGEGHYLYRNSPINHNLVRLSTNDNYRVEDLMYPSAMLIKLREIL